MTCKITCSVGELVDKISILSIKLDHADSTNARKNIQNELDVLKKENPIQNTQDPLFDELRQINAILWDLEDSIRIKSKRNEFDGDYITLAESIHKTNDLRYSTKRNINEKYSSQIIEEKIYKS